MGAIPAKKPQRLAHWVCALFSYLLLAVAYTWPLCTRLLTHVPGDNGDAAVNLWPFWYMPRALLNDQQAVFTTNMLLHPEGASLLLHSSSFLAALLSSPLQIVLGVTGAFNAWLLISLALGAFFFCLMCRELGLDWRASWIGGAAFGFSPFIGAHLPGHYTLIQTVWVSLSMFLTARLLLEPVEKTRQTRTSLPVSSTHNSSATKSRIDNPICLMTRFILARSFFKRLFKDRTARRMALHVIALGASFWAVAITDLYLAVQTCLLCLVVGFHVGVNRQVLVPWNKILVNRVLPPVIVAAVLMVPWVMMLRTALDTHDYASSLPASGSEWTLTWEKLVTLPPYHPLWGPLMYQEGARMPAAYRESTYAGLVALGLAGFALAWRGAARRPIVWIAALAVCFLLGAGNRHSLFPGAPRWLMLSSWLPDVFPINQMRVPSRFHFSICAILAFLAALGAAQILIRYSQRKQVFQKAIFMGITALLFFDLAAAPTPLFDTRPTPWFTKHKLDGDRALLTFPIGIVNGLTEGIGTFDSRQLLDQMAHGKPLLSGYLSRIPYDVLDARKTDHGFQAVLATASGKTPAPEITSADWANFCKRYNIGWIQIGDDLPVASPLRELVGRSFPVDQVFQADGFVMYRLQ